MEVVKMLEKKYYLTYNKNDEEIGVNEALWEFRKNEPFYAHFLHLLKIYTDKSIPTACVTFDTQKNMLLKINPRLFETDMYIATFNRLGYTDVVRFSEEILEGNKNEIGSELFKDGNLERWDYFDILGKNKSTLSLEEIEEYNKVNSFRRNVNNVAFKYKSNTIKHEILHIIFEHLFRGNDFPQQQVANIAMDILVWQYCDKDYILDGRAVIDKFPELKLERNKPTEYYYEKLLDLKNRAEQEEKEMGQSQSNKSDDNDSGDKEGDLVNNPSNTISWKYLKKFLTQDFGHDFMNFSNNISSAEKELLKSKLEIAIKDAIDKSRGRGYLPGDLAYYLENFMKSDNVVDWRERLKRFATKRIDTKKKQVLRKRSRRYGTVPGIASKTKCNLLVVTDTSGSVTDKEIEIFFNELYHMYRTKRATIFYCQVDAELRVFEDGSTYKQYKGEEMVEVLGRGGTDFTPAFELYNNNRKFFDGLIYFTDGYCSPPEVTYNPTEVLWVITEDGAELGEEFLGNKIRINK